MSNLVTDPIFTADTAAGRKEFGLFELMASAVGGELLDLPRMAAHQRASLITVLAIFMHVLSRYGNVKRISASSWAAAWDALICHEALRITAPHDEVAFLQPPTDAPSSKQSIEAADFLLPNVEHEVKRIWSAERAETAIWPHDRRPARLYTGR